MQRQRGELVPVGEVIADLDGPVKAIREASPQALHHFTQADQVNQLVGASEAEADLGFMARMLVLCSLPRTNPGNRLQYKRVNGPYSLIMTAVGQTKLPFGNLPRLLLAWLCTEGVRTQNRELSWGSRSRISCGRWVWSPSAAFGPASATRCGASSVLMSHWSTRISKIWSSQVRRSRTALSFGGTNASLTSGCFGIAKSIWGGVLQ